MNHVKSTAVPAGAPAPSTLKADQILLAAVVAGLLSAFGELALQWARQWRGVAVIDQGPGVAWMAPLGSVAAFLLIGLLVVLLSRLARSLRRTAGIAFLFAFLVCGSVFTVIPMLHIAAAGILALGVAWQISRWAGRNSERAVRWLSTGASWLVPAALAIGIGGGDLWPRLQETVALRALPEPEEGSPNVLLLILDTVRGESMSLYGYDRETTPELTALAARSVVFDRAMAPSPWTLPSHASAFTGEWPHRLSADWLDPLDDAQPVLADVLAGRGYATSGFVANLVYTHRGWGLARGFSHYEDFPVSVGQIINSFNLGRIVSNLGIVRRATGFHDVLNRKSAGDLNRSLLHWIDRVEPGRPFFAFVNYFDAHEPLFPPAPYDRQFGEPGVVGPFRYTAQKVNPTDRYSWSEARIAAERDAYDGAIAYLDRSLGDLFQEIERRGLLDNTLVIITGDHGEQFGEHRLLAHGNSVYTQLVKVPLLMRLPNAARGGVRVRQTVSLAGIPATVMKIVAGDPSPFPGAALDRFWVSGRAGTARDTIIAEVTGGFAESDLEPIAAGDVRSAFVGPWHYIINGDGREELYNLDDDPAEERNLAADPANANRLHEMRSAFGAVWQDTGRQPRLRR